MAGGESKAYFLTLCLSMISLAMHAGGPDSLTGLPGDGCKNRVKAFGE